MSPQELVKSREIRKVSEFDLLEGGRKKGLKVMELIKDSILDSISSGLPDSVYIEKILKLAIDNSTISSLKVGISCLLSSEITKASIIQQQEILEAYQYSFENKLPVVESVELAKDNENVLFQYPVIIKGELKGLWTIAISNKSIINAME